MQQAWSDVDNLLSEMRPILALTKIPPRQLEMPKADPNRIQVKTYTKVYDWLHQVKLSEEYQNVEYAYNLVPPEQWEAYDMHEIEGLQEQLILAKAASALQQRWKQDRPSFFGRDYKHERMDGEEGSDVGVQEGDS